MPLDPPDRAGMGAAGDGSERGDRFGLPFDLDLAKVFPLEERGCQAIRGVRDPHRAGLGGLLHAGGDIHRITHGRVLLALERTDAADHHGACVDADPHVEVRAGLALELLAEWPDGLQHLQACEDRSLRIVLVRLRRSKESEHRVAQEPDHCPFVASDGSDEKLERLIHQVGPILWVELFGHRG